MPLPTPACDREPTVGPYHDGELSVARREEFERHLATGAACAAELKRVQAVSRWLEPLRRPALSPAAKNELARWAVSAAAEADDAEAERLRIRPAPAARWARWATTAAAAVFLFSVVQLYRAKQVAPGDPPTGGAGGVPAMQRSTTGPKESPDAKGGVESPAGNPRPAQPDTGDLGGGE